MNDENAVLEGREKIEALEAKIAELEEKLAARHEETRDEKIHALEANAKAQAKHLYEELGPFLEKYKGEGRELEELICDKIRKHPGASLALAFGAGLAAAVLLDRKR